MENTTRFAPMLAIPSGITDISFYTKAFGAVELQRWSNDDGSIHVAELSIDGAMFHVHEPTERVNTSTPFTAGITTVTIGLFVDDVHALVANAENAGARILSPVQDYYYGYRQGEILDPFGHLWQIQKKI